MLLKPRLEAQLQIAREYSEKLLAAFKSPQDWTHQVHPKANHALWFAGHLATADNFFVSLLAPQRAKLPPGFDKLFGMGSVPSGDPAAYPAPSEVLATLRDRRQVLLDVLAGCSEADLAKPLPPGSPGFLRDTASVFETAIWHEGLHAGQVSVAHRALGNPPLF